MYKRQKTMIHLIFCFIKMRLLKNIHLINVEKYLNTFLSYLDNVYGKIMH